MIRHSLFMFVVVLVLVGCAPAAYPKGSPDKIVITGGRLARAIEINERETLKAFDPWRGQFIDWTKGTVAGPFHQDQPYEIFFYMKWPGRRSNYDRGELKMIYAVRYVPGRDDERGYIYLPGSGEEFYGNNTGTILRGDDDGKWHQASAAWDAVMKRLMAESEGQHESFIDTALWSIAISVIDVCRLSGE